MALINPDNLSILVSHIQCAAFELPFEDGQKFGRVEIEEILKLLEEEEMLHHTQNKWFWTSEAYPATPSPCAASVPIISWWWIPPINRG